MAEEAQDTPQESKGRSLKPIIFVAVVLVVEAVAIVGAMMLLGGPAEVEAVSAMGELMVPAEETIQEIQVVDAKLPNNKTGVTYLYDTEIWLQVKAKHAPRVQEELERFRNEIRADITAIWRTSEPHHFEEPKLETLTRKMEVLLGERFGVDPETEEPIVSKCVVVMATGLRIDS